MSPPPLFLALSRPKPLFLFALVLTLLTTFGLWSNQYSLPSHDRDDDLALRSTGFEQDIIPARGSKTSPALDPSSGLQVVQEKRTRANATFVVLVRNEELFKVSSTTPPSPPSPFISATDIDSSFARQQLLEPMQQLEDRFNHWAGYDFQFLNDVPFTEEFIKHTSAIASTNTYYGLINGSDWNQPEWIDEEKATAGRADLQAQGIIYADSIPYRNMCRFNAGFYYRHPLLLPYRYAWRFEPEVKFFCDIAEDPFLTLEREKKVYGFTVTVFEFLATIPSLWEATKEFIALHPDYLAEDNSMGYISDDGGESYNGCHFWTNFEIVDMDFWRGEAYSAYFDFLDRKGGFYYERWGDAPVHSLAIALFAPKGSVKFFSEIGYQHTHVVRCPVGEAHVKGRCSCRESENFDNQGWSCLSKWKGIQEKQSWFGSP